MDIKILGGNGLHASETRAVKKMGQNLRNSWFGYASLLVADDQGSMDVDTLIITHDRLLLVELKEWNGKLESSDGRWYLNGSPRGKSPYEIKRVQALRISRLLQKELEHKLGYYPRVEAHVVLCGTATPERLSTSERRFVHTLDEFLKISETTEYNGIVEEATSYTNLFDRYGKPRPNSEKSKPIFQGFFAGSRVRPKEFTHFSYTAEPHPWFKHRQGLFTEYKGHHQEAANDVALMRRWDFSALGVGSATQAQWSRIALRESRVFSHAKAHERGLEEYLLRPLIPLSADDVSEDLTELYELRRTFSRLDEHLSKNGKTLTPDGRLDLVRAIVAPFAELHGLGIAHRDVDLHNLWHASEQKSVLISGFAASFFPERGTVSDLRELLQGSHIRLPEDVFHLAGDILDPFRQDVFMLGAAAYRVLYPSSPLPKDEHGIWQWSQPREDPYQGQLDHWLKTSLSLEAAERFGNATEMLAALNDAVKPAAPNEEEAASTWQSIADGEFIKRGWGPFQIFRNFPPDPNEDPGSGQVMKYRCTVDGEPALLKFWQQVAPNATTHGLNRRLAAFRSKAEKVAAGGIPTPTLMDLGLLESGGLYVLTKLEPGHSWKIASIDRPIEQRRRLAKTLIKAVTNLHDQQLGHGDIHPENLLVSEAGSTDQTEGSPAVLLLDMLDFGEQAQPFNMEYGPANPAAADAFARDRFAVYKLVEELLHDENDAEFKRELAIGRDQPLGIPVALDPLLEQVQRLLEPSLPEQSTPSLDPICIVPPKVGNAAVDFLLEQDDGGYHFNCRWDKRSDEILNCYVTGMNGSITFVVDPEQRQLRDVRWRSPIALSDIVSASSKSRATISQPLKIVRTLETGNGHGKLLDLLLGLDPVVSLLEDRFAPHATETHSDETGVVDATTDAIWRVLLDTEQESRLEVEVIGAVEEERNGKLQVPYRSVDGRAMDFESDDRVLVSIDRDDGDFAVLDVLETTLDELVIELTRSDAKRRLQPGSRLRLESIQSKAPRDWKAKAMERVLARASVIPDLAGYFTPGSSVGTRSLSERPSIDRIKELYDTEDQKLNPRQIHAFMELVERGPVGVLQGPPGTGKTTFVGAFIHYLFSELGVRNVLLVGQSHTAVDAVAMKTRSMCSRHEMPLSVVRMGQEPMLATGMLDAHSRAIQRQMRHTFHREYEHRIEVFSDRLGLPEELTAEVAALHRTLDGLFASIRRYETEITAARSQPASEELRIRTPDIQGQLNEVKSLRDRIVHQRFPDTASAILAAGDPWGAIVDQVADLHGVNNPSAISRLRSLLSLSQEWLSVLHAGQSNYDQFLVQTRQLVCGTLVGMGKKELGVAEAEFDWVIVDEAARAQASELMIPLQSARRVLLVGDHRQLPPFYELSHIRAACRKIHISEERIRKTDFERAFQVTQGVTLDTQYRMIDPIGQLVSECFYKEDGVQLNTGRGDSPGWFSDLPYPLNTPVTWIDSGSAVDATGEDEQGRGRYINVHEARLTMRLLQRLTRPDTISRLKSELNGALHPIGVITMYRGQKLLLEKELSKAEWAAPIRSLIRIDTVDSYQGQENPFIILSLVRDNTSKKQGFMVDPSRINVSLSRAQERLVVVGAARMWQSRNRTDPLGRVLAFIEERCASGHSNYTITRDLPEFVFTQEREGVAENA